MKAAIVLIFLTGRALRICSLLIFPLVSFMSAAQAPGDRSVTVDDLGYERSYIEQEPRVNIPEFYANVMKVAPFYRYARVLKYAPAYSYEDDTKLTTLGGTHVLGVTPYGRTCAIIVSHVLLSHPIRRNIKLTVVIVKPNVRLAPRELVKSIDIESEITSSFDVNENGDAQIFGPGQMPQLLQAESDGTQLSLKTRETESTKLFKVRIWNNYPKSAKATLQPAGDEIICNAKE